MCDLIGVDVKLLELLTGTGAYSHAVAKAARDAGARADKLLTPPFVPKDALGDWLPAAISIDLRSAPRDLARLRTLAQERLIATAIFSPASSLTAGIEENWVLQAVQAARPLWLVLDFPSIWA